MKDKFNIGWYMFALIGGIASGAMFSKAQYHKGQADAYQTMADELDDICNNAEKELAKLTEKEEAQ